MRKQILLFLLMLTLILPMSASAKSGGTYTISKGNWLVISLDKKYKISKITNKNSKYFSTKKTTSTKILVRGKKKTNKKAYKFTVTCKKSSPVKEITYNIKVN